MQDVGQALADVKGMFPKVVGQVAPEIPPNAYLPFPPGVDPISFAIQEAEQLTKLYEQVKIAPTPYAWVPHADSFVGDDVFLIHVEVPGISREDLRVFVVGGECVVRGERKHTDLSGKLRPMTVERTWGTFERRFVLPAGCDPNKLSARYQNGILELRIAIEPQKTPEPTEIDVK